MYFKQTCNIELSGKYRLRGLHACEIKRSVHQIVQSAKLQLPLSVVFRNQQLLSRIRLVDKIKVGDAVKIDLGYNGNNRTEFTGYIKRINAKQPLELELEDEMYLMRKVIFKKSFKKAQVRDVLKYLLDGLNEKYNTGIELYKEIPDLTVTNFVIDNASGVEALQALADTYFLASYLVTLNGKKTLYSGLKYGLMLDEIKYKINRNVISVDELKYDESDVGDHRVNITNIKNDGSVYKFSYGNKKDTAFNFYYYGDYTEAQLKHMADAELAKKVTGYRGTFETFLIPNAQPGNIANITDEQFNRNGRGYIGTVTTTFGSGARRKPEIDISL
ncbi:MAG: hypothetical protein ACTHK8_19055 [Ginsengibacter sp.]